VEKDVVEDVIIETPLPPEKEHTPPTDDKSGTGNTLEADNSPSGTGDALGTGDNV
jgi:hypothetical protein